MKPKIAYLINESTGWYGDEEADWKFYPEDKIDRFLQSKIDNGHGKRIIYWEVEEETNR